MQDANRPMLLNTPQLPVESRESENERHLAGLGPSNQTFNKTLVV